MHLIIAEKHNVAKRIAHILAGSKPTVKRVRGIDTFRFDDKVVLGLSGHIVGVDYPSGYNNWQKVDYRDLIHAQVVSKPTQQKIVSALHDLGKEADKITVATDYDREGELIGAERIMVAGGVCPSATSLHRLGNIAVFEIGLSREFGLEVAHVEEPIHVHRRIV